MDLFMIIFFLLMCCWSIIYAYKNISISTKYKICIINFSFTVMLILGIYYYSKDLWKFSVTSWILIPNIVAGSLVPLIALILYTIIKDTQLFK